MRRAAPAALVAVALAAAGYAQVAPATPPRAGDERLEIPPPPFSEGIFPCSSC